MSSEIPQISITQAINGNISESSEEEDSIGGICPPGDITDIEDFNSHDEVSDGEDFTKLLKSMYHTSNSPSRKQSISGVTDIEDYVDSASEDEKSEAPEIKLSFREFLDNGSIEEEFHNADGMKTRSAVKIGKRKCSSSNVQHCILKDDEKNQNITDSENYDTTGDDVSEIEDRMINTNLIPYYPEMGSLEMADKIDVNIKKKHKVLNKTVEAPELSDASSDKVNQTPSDDASDESSNDDDDGDMNYNDNDMSYSDADGAIGGAVSEVEDLLCSGVEEVINMHDSDENTSDIDSDSIYDDYPHIDVKFITTYTKDRPHKLKKPIKSNNKSNYLNISEASEGPLTDIEKLDDSQAEGNDSENDSDNENGTTSKGILIARAIVAQETHTDSEDFEFSNDMLSEMFKFKRVSAKMIPPPIRELIKVRENINGDPITTVEQLDDDLEIGLHDYVHELYKTDEEIFSDNEINPTLLKIESRNLRRNSPIFMENEITQNYESVKNLNIKRLDNIEEPTTDIEEIFMSGTARRKRSVKSKTSSSNRNKPQQRLSAAKSTSNIIETKTDTEEFFLSDYENSRKLTKSKSDYQLPSSSSDAIMEAIQALSICSLSPEPKTDIENFSYDDSAASISDIEQKCPSDVEFLGKENYISTISSRDALTERGLKIIRRPSPIFKQLLKDEECFQSEGNSQCVTDVEDIALISDVEDSPFNNNNNSNCNIDNNAAVSKELNDALEECCHSVVYEKSKNTFDAEKEKDFIKGNQFSDAYTDIEYIEEEQAKEATDEN